MKAILLALAAGVLLLLIGTLRLRNAPSGNGAATMTKVFLAILLALLTAHLLTPPGLGFLPPILQIPVRAVDLGFAVFLYGAGYFGGVLQLYNLAERGFSLRILIDILHAPTGEMTIDEVMKAYGGGKGIAWMYDKRIEGMTATGLAVESNGRLVLTVRGRRVSRLFALLQNFVSVKCAEARR